MCELSSFADSAYVIAWPALPSCATVYGLFLAACFNNASTSILSLSILTPFSGTGLTESQKQIVVNSLKDYSVISTQPVIVDPKIVSVLMDVVFRYDENLTSNTSTQLVSMVKNKITSYVVSNLELFDKMFRFSEISALIDNTDSSILSNVIRMNMTTSIIPNLSTAQSYTINFYNALFNPHEGHTSVITTTPFKVTGSTIDHFLDDDGKGNLRLYNLVGTTKTYVNNLFGTVDYSIGKIVISSATITSTSNTDGTIRFLAIPNSNDIVPTREQVITIDLSNLIVSSVTDNFELTSAQSSFSGVFSTLNITKGDVFANSIVDVRNYITGTTASTSSASSSSSSSTSSSY